MLTVARTWNDAPVDRDEVAWVAVTRRGDGGLVVDVRANLQGDPPPDAPPGRLDHLWEHEVVEVFILGSDGHYTELEMGPHGHYLVLRFRGERDEIGRDYTIEYSAERTGEKWRGKAVVPAEFLPAPPFKANAYAIHGQGERRRYLAAHPGEGEPDFHKVAYFRALVF